MFFTKEAQNQLKRAKVKHNWHTIPGPPCLPFCGSAPFMLLKVRPRRVLEEVFVDVNVDFIGADVDVNDADIDVDVDVDVIVADIDADDVEFRLFEVRTRRLLQGVFTIAMLMSLILMLMSLTLTLTIFEIRIPKCSPPHTA